MTTGKLVLVSSLFAAALALASCGGGSSPFSDHTVESVTQDLTVDPDGKTTVFAFAGPAPQLAPGNFESDSTAVPLGATVSGATIAVEWDERVTPTHEVRIVGFAGIDEDFRPVATSDASVPTFAIASATQGTGLGNDSIIVEFSGPRVAPETVLDGDNWALLVDGSVFPLTGSALGWNVADQVLTIATDTTVNVHADFSLRATGIVSVADSAVSSTPVAGAATGDTTAPTLIAVEQSLPHDEFGRVVEFTFSEAMDPAFSTQTTNFSTGVFLFATAVSQPAPERIRATFPTPVVPGLDTVGLWGMVDAHGNPFPTGVQAVAAGSLVANAYALDPEVRTVSGVGGDQVIATTLQALEPDSAEDPSNWTLAIDGSAVDLSLQTLDYDLLTKTLTITLVDDTTNGLGFDLTPAGPLDVDGEAFVAAFSGVVDGDVLLPSVLTSVQNRDVDPSGETLDVTFDEDVDETSAELTGNWTVSGGITVTAAVRQADASVVRLTLDSVAVPGEQTVEVGGVTDIAGNAMTPVAGLAVTSTDTTAPNALSASAEGVAGLDNDTVTVRFDDSMLPADVTDQSHWTVESPVGTALDTSAASVTYDVNDKTATLTFDGGDGIDFFVEDDFSVAVTGVRDLAGNTITPDTLSGTVAVERVQPQLEAAYVKDSPEDNVVVVVFDEPIAAPDSFVTAELEDGVDNVLGAAAAFNWSASAPRELELTFGQVVLAGTHEVNLRGVLDAGGNPFFTVEDYLVASQSNAELALDGATVVATVAGEDNDVVNVVFGNRPSAWRIDDVANYSLADGGSPFDLAGAVIDYQGGSSLTLSLPSGNALATGTNYTLGIDGLETAQGVPMTAADTLVVAASGDATPPTMTANRTRLDPAASANSVFVEFDEAVDPTGAALASNFAIGATNPDTAVLVGPRSVHLTFSGGVAISDTIDVNLDDLAGNAGVMSQAVVGADSAGPLVGSITAHPQAGVGGDYLTVTFNEPVDSSKAVQQSSYVVTMDDAPVDLGAATFRYSSVGNTVRIDLPSSFDWDIHATVQVTVDGVDDVAGNAMALPAVVNAVFDGDAVAADFDAAFVDLRESASGNVVLVRFDEDVRFSSVAVPGGWTIGGGQTVTAVEQVTDDTVKLTLSAPLGVGEVVQHGGSLDVAGNVAGVLTVTPTH